MSKRILMAMSGGIDSSVAAILLRKQQYEVIGATYRTYDQISQECISREKGCCTVDAIFEAQQMAHNLGMEHHIIDLREEFASTVIANFIDEYMCGRTPNPCVVCNATIKWGKMMEWADRLGCDAIATGHYARIGVTDEGRYYLRRGADTAKDQTYFLWRLSQDNLHRTHFPLGDYVKPEVRQMALDAGFERLSKKTESQEICFVPDNDYRHFLYDNVPDFDTRCKMGNFIDKNGNVLGQHTGCPNYTIGQRKGLGVAFGSPRYVTQINATANTVTLGLRDDLLSSKCRLKSVNMMKYADFTDGTTIMAKLRYRSNPVPADIYHCPEGIELRFPSPAESVTPGQSAVLYTGPDYNDVLAGGIIC